VPFTLPGETVAVSLDNGRGTLRDLIGPSPDRIAPFCPHFGNCGGCQLQHMAPSAYRAYKRERVVAALAQARLDFPVAEPVDAAGNGRRRASLHVRRHGAGYMRWHSHDVLAIDHCPILVPALTRAPGIAAALHRILGECDVHFSATLTGLDLMVRTRGRARPEALVSFARRHDLARLTVDGELVVQARPPLVRMGRAEIELPPGSFLQASEAAEEVLAGLVTEALAGRKAVADLFSGLGPFTFRLAERARVQAFDSDAAAIAALDKAMRKTSGLKPITARRRDLFREPLTRFELVHLDGVVFDPPRAGAEAQARELAGARVKTIVAVSCEPRSFARDAAILVGGGYHLETVTPVDQFAFSSHVEIVGVFRR
jgi:23S rRNA (uracil1939-C5)-methyltransferase